MMRFGLSTFLVLISVCAISSCTSSISGNNPTNTRGNTVGNISNLGLVAKEGDWIYYNSFKDNKHSLRKKKIYKAKKSIKIFDELGLFLNVVDGWIYYLNHSDGYSIYKTRIDCTERIKIYSYTSESSENQGERIYFEFINVQGEWIYFLNYSENLDYGKSGKIFKIRTDGSNLTKITDDRFVLIYIINDSIFAYDDEEDQKIYIIPADGSTKPQLVK